MHDFQTDSIRCQALYAYLECRGNNWTPMRTVVRDLIGFYGEQTVSTFHNSYARRMLTADIQAINEHSEFNKLIIHSNFGIKLANEEESAAYLGGQYASLFRKLRRVRLLEKKAGMNGQFSLFDMGAIEAFISDEREGLRI